MSRVNKALLHTLKLRNYNKIKTSIDFFRVSQLEKYLDNMHYVVYYII